MQSNWFTVEKIDAQTFAISEYKHWEETHCYLLCGTERAVLIDTGLGVANIKEAVERLTDLPVAVLTIYSHNKALYNQLDSFVNFIVSQGEEVAKDLNVKNVIYKEREIRAISRFLNAVKNVKANEFREYEKEIEKLTNEYLKTYGHQFSYEVDFEPIRKIFDSDVSLLSKLLCVTFVKDKKKDKFVSCLACPSIGKQGIVDLVHTNIPTNEYFTISHQELLDLKLLYGAFAMQIVFLKEEMFSEMFTLYLDIIDFIKSLIDIKDEELNQDLKLLFQMIDNIYHNGLKGDDEVIPSLCYGTAMFICAYVEKFLRILYVAMRKNEIYIPISKVTLKGLFTESSHTLEKIFGEHHLRHLNFFFCKDTDGEVGHNYRNRLAHWNDIEAQHLSLKLVCELFYLLTNILLSAYNYFTENNRENTNETAQ